MKRYGFFALAALAFVGLIAGGAYAGAYVANQCCPMPEGCQKVYIYPQGSGIAGMQGAGPSDTAQCPIPVLICPGPCDPAAVERQYCGAFCTSGQITPGWQYGWCDQYWLRPDTNL